MSVLQDIYDSEVDIYIATFWDGGYEVKIGNFQGGWVAEGKVDRFGMVEAWFIEQMFKYYPHSSFVHQYRDELTYIKDGIHPRAIYMHVNQYLRFRDTGDLGFVTKSKIEDGKLYHLVGGAWHPDESFKILTHDETMAIKSVIKKADAPEDPGINN